MSLVELALLVLTAIAWISCGVQLTTLVRISRRRFDDPPTWPKVSVLKPLCGDDEDLVANLESHLELDYPGAYEVILGVRDASDPAYPIAKAFAEKHAAQGRVRLVMQEGEPGFNPKVNQLITLTRHAKYDVLALTDAGVRVEKHWLRENVCALASPGVGLSTNIFSGVGEESLGAAFDNMTMSSFCGASMATGEALGYALIVGKSLALSKATLAKLGGWEEVKDLLAEDQRLGWRLYQAKIKSRACSTFVQVVQHRRPLRHFWERHSRWSMLRWRTLPGFWLEPLLNPTIWPLALVCVAPAPATAGLLAATCLVSIVYSDLCSRVTRGYGNRPQYAWLTPLRDVLLFAAWCRGITLRTVNWRGNVLKVGKKTLLTRVEGVTSTEPAAQPRPPS